MVTAKKAASSKKKGVTSNARLLLIDGHSMAYRAFYGLPVENFTTNQGQPTNILYGFSNMLMGLIQSEKPTHIAVAFDRSRKTFRSELFPEYKAQRSATPDEFKAQMELLFQLVEAFGIRHFSLDSFEADDIIATFAHRAAPEGFEVLICSGDRDSFQLVNEQVTVLYPKKGVTELARMTPEAIIEKYGLTPVQYPDFAALRGDPSDNLPSLPGVGEKTATKWILEFGDLGELLLNADKISGKVGDSLRSGIEAVKLNRHLTQLRFDCPIDEGVAELEWRGINKKHLQRFYQNLEIKALASRVSQLPANPDEPDPAAATGDEWEEFLNEGGQTPSTLQAEKERPAPKAWSPEVVVKKSGDKGWKKLITPESGFVAIDVLHEGGVISQGAISLDGDQFYLLDANEIIELLADESIPKALFAAKAIARKNKITNLYADGELSAYLLNPGTRHLELSDLTARYLGIEAQQETLDLFTQYDGKNAAYIYRVVHATMQELEEREMLPLLTDLETPVLLSLSQMEARGIAVDRTKLEKIYSEFLREVEKSTQAAYEAAGKEFNVNSPKQLQVILFEDLKLPKTKKIKTGYTTDADSLQWLLEETDHPVLQHLMRIREAGKLATTVNGLIESIAADGRIHTDFQQTVAATGRLSSTNPNLQNIPVRTDEGRKIRDCFIAGEGYPTLLTADYSQIEMRIMAHLSKDVGLIKAFNMGEDLHSTVASLVFGVEAEGVTSEMRRQIKAMSYGLAYGLSAFGLSQQLSLTPGEAGALMNKYFERFGGIRDYLKLVVDQAKRDGYTSTILGRRRYLPDLLSDNRQRRETAERMALNAPIQGSAADIIKIAMLRVDEAISLSNLKSRSLLQVHDELIFEVAPGEEKELEELVRKAMGEAYPLSIPLEVNVGVGESWDQAAH